MNCGNMEDGTKTKSTCSTLTFFMFLLDCVVFSQVPSDVGGLSFNIIKLHKLPLSFKCLLYIFCLGQCPYRSAGLLLVFSSCFHHQFSCFALRTPY